MSDEINPALSAQHWTDYLQRPAESVEWLASTGGGMERIVALANAALPADSPYRLTRNDARAILIRSEAFPELAPIAAKLAALLPPG